MKSFRVGTLSNYLSARVISFGIIGGLFVFTLLGYRAWMDSSAECVRCHSDKKKVAELRAPWAYVTDEMVRKESGHPHIECRDCHLGNGRAKDKDNAHKGMLRMLIVSEEGSLLRRSEGYPYGLGGTGDDRLLAFLPKMSAGGQQARNILWHDRDPETFDFDPRIAEKTCGKGGCHPEILLQFKTSAMGGNHRQRIMRSWLEPYGPHNCGPSFADLPPSDVHDKPLFDFTNTGKIQEEVGVPFSAEQAKDKQKFCNVCHTGCLDCHYTPGYKRSSDPEKHPTFQNADGVHSFSRFPPAESCAGFGRGSSICHPGSMQSRRGETYIGGDYSVPQGMTPDVHYKKGIDCTGCHPTGEGGMGHVERKASCQDCHLEIEDAHSRDVHRTMDCATCHIGELRGYQITVWGPGKVAGKENPFTKYSLYYGTQSPPVLIKDQKGVWMPVKVWPHSLANVKNEVPASKGLQFRWRNGETRDAYAISGTYQQYLLWLELQQAAHPFGPARKCGSCHASSRQVAVSRWQFLDDQGAEPFSGGYRVIAGKEGLRITGLAATSPIRLLPGYKLTDFAPWLFLRDKWAIPGDFSIKADPGKYRKYRELSRAVQEKIKVLDSRSLSFDRKTGKKYQALRSFALHNPEEGLKKLNGEFPGLK